MQVDLDKAALRAPFDAVVITRWIDEGQILSPGQPVYDYRSNAPADYRGGAPVRYAAAEPSIAQGQSRFLGGIGPTGRRGFGLSTQTS